MNLKPLQDRIVVRAAEAETTTAGGIFIPDNATENPTTGEVLAVGPGKHDEKGNLRTVSVKIGDRVLFGQTAGQKVKVQGEEVTILFADEIMAIVN